MDVASASHSCVKEPNMAERWNPGMQDTAKAWLNPKTRAKALARAKERAPYKMAWRNMLASMEEENVTKMTARATGDWTAVNAERQACVAEKAKAKATTKPKAKAKAKAQPKASPDALVAGMAKVVPSLSDAQVMAFINALAQEVADRKK